MFNETGHADGVVQAVVAKHMEQLRGSAGGSTQAEEGQGSVPHGKHPAKLEPRPTLHVVLAAEDEHHVDPHVVETRSPVLGHPHSRVLVHELLFEVEHIGVVGGGPRFKISTVHLEAVATNLQIDSTVAERRAVRSKDWASGAARRGVA